MPKDSSQRPGRAALMKTSLQSQSPYSTRSRRRGVTVGTDTDVTAAEDHSPDRASAPRSSTEAMEEGRDPIDPDAGSDLESWTPKQETRESSQGTSNTSDSELVNTIGRLNRQVKSKNASLVRCKNEVKDLKEKVAELEEELAEKESTIEHLTRSEVQYRNWWLNEIQFTKLLLNKIPDPKRDMDLVRTSQAHYVGHY